VQPIGFDGLVAEERALLARARKELPDSRLDWVKSRADLKRVLKWLAGEGQTQGRRARAFLQELKRIREGDRPLVALDDQPKARLEKPSPCEEEFLP